MSGENPLWGASRIHGELLMLGFEVAQSTVSKYLVRSAKPPSQTWTTFLRNHAGAIAAIDLSVVPTLTFDLLFAFLVLGHGRRQLLWFEVTRHPTAEWLARQITEAFPWASALNRRPIEPFGDIVAHAILGGLHHRYTRIEFLEATMVTPTVPVMAIPDPAEAT